MVSTFVTIAKLASIWAVAILIASQFSSVQATASAVPSNYANDTTVRFACSIQVAHSGNGVLIVSTVADRNATLLTVYDANLALLANFTGPSLNGADVSSLACKGTISDDLKTVFVSISTSTPGSANDPAKVAYILGNPVTGNYTIHTAWTSDNVSSTARSVASSADGVTTVFSVPATTFIASQLEVWVKNTSDSTSPVYLQQNIPWAVNDTSTAWNDDVDMSTSGNTIFVLSPTQGSVYVFDRLAFGDNYTFTTVLTYNTSGHAFTSFAAAGDGLRVFATFDWSVTNTDNSTTEYNGVAVWSYDATQLAWDTTPVIVTSGVATLNTTTNITTIAYTYKIAKPISACKQGRGFIAPVYINSSTAITEKVLFASFNEANDSTWTATNFPAPANSTLPLGASIAVRQVSPTGYSIGFTHMLSDSGFLAVVPTEQNNSTTTAYWADSYISVTDCGQVTPVPATPGNADATWVIVAFTGLGFFIVVAVALAAM